MTKAVFFTLGLLCLFGPAPAAHPSPTRARTYEASPPAAQQTADDELKRLRELAKQGKDDPEPWREYGEALARAGDRQGAVKAFAEAIERYVKLYDIPVRPTRGPGPTREEAARNRAEMAAKLRRAPEAVEQYIQLGGAQPGFEREQLEAFAAHARLLNEPDPDRGIYVPTELDRKALILDKPAPAATEEARKKRTSGLVRLRAVLAGDGTVRHVFVVKGLPNGLTEASVAVARRIKFEPAVKDGKPVSQFIVLEYNFNTF